MHCLALTLLLAASNVYSDPLGHAGGTPIAGTYTTAASAAAITADARPMTTAEGATSGAWDARTAFWTVLDGWMIYNPSGFLLLFR